MKKLLLAAQEHIANDIHFLIIGSPKDIYLLGLAIMETSGKTLIAHNDSLESYHFELDTLREVASPGVSFGIGSLEQMADELLLSLGEESLVMNDLLLRRRDEAYMEHLILSKDQRVHRIIKEPLKSVFNSHSRQTMKSVRRKR